MLMKKDTWKTAIKRVLRELAPNLPSGSSLFKFIIQMIVAILTAIATTLGVTACMGAM